MKRVSCCLSSTSRVPSLSTELSLDARNIVSHLFKKEEGKKKRLILLQGYTRRTSYLPDTNLIG